MNSTRLLELSDGEELIVEGRTRMVLSPDPRDRALAARRQAIDEFSEAAGTEASQ